MSGLFVSDADFHPVQTVSQPREHTLWAFAMDNFDKILMLDSSATVPNPVTRRNTPFAHVSPLWYTKPVGNHDLRTKPVLFPSFRCIWYGSTVNL
jgi:hypothetical protein